MLIIHQGQRPELEELAGGLEPIRNGGIILMNNIKFCSMYMICTS